jgi:hypothetical protein
MNIDDRLFDPEGVYKDLGLTDASPSYRAPPSIDYSNPSFGQVVCPLCSQIYPYGSPHVCAFAQINSLPYQEVHKCPCCDGWGQRQGREVASSGNGWVQCPTCDGKGVIWKNG